PPQTSKPKTDSKNQTTHYVYASTTSIIIKQRNHRLRTTKNRRTIRRLNRHHIPPHNHRNTRPTTKHTIKTLQPRNPQPTRTTRLRNNRKHSQNTHTHTLP